MYKRSCMAPFRFSARLFRLSYLSCSCFFAPALLGCSSSRIPDEGPVSWNKFSSLLPKVVCDRVLECDCPMDKRGGTDKKHCKNSVERYLNRLSPMDNDGTKFDGDLAWQCLDAAEKSDCTHAAWLPFCERVLQPMFEEGESCESDYQCKGVWEQQAYCDDAGTCKAGQRDFTRKQGESCRYTLAPKGIATGTDYPDGAPPPEPGVCLLSDGLRCERGECVPVVEEGGPCVPLLDCALGTYCADGVCAPELTPGDQCPREFDFACGFESYCNEQRVCVKQNLDGEVCSENSQCASHSCSPFGTCVPTAQETVCEHFFDIEIGD